MSAPTRQLRPRIETAERVISSICPYCAVCCGRQIYVKDARWSRSRATPPRTSAEAASARKDLPPFSSPQAPRVAMRFSTGPVCHRLGGLLIATEPKQALISVFDLHGGAGRPKVGQLPICYVTDRDAAVARVHEQFCWFGSGWPVNSELPGPAGFAGATRFVRPEDVARSIPCGDHQEPYLEWAQQKLLPALHEL